MLKIYNSLTKKIEEFKPIDENNVKIYCCGSTVYDRAHLGHARTNILIDIFVRLLRELYKNVIYVRNITDVDDKINKRAVERGITIQELTTETIKFCNEDLEYLNVKKPTYEPKATEHIKEIVDMIQRLITNGNAYVSNDHVLFDVNSYKGYGKLSNRNIDELMAGSRIEIGDYKKDPMDFVLWKPSLSTDDDSSKFNSPWGVGRPGWHIECSAMSYKYLGENFDIHCGGGDLRFPHHENEIAQSCCAFKGSNFANYWIHTGMLTLNNEKMSKSTGNFVTVKQLRDKGINGCVVRFAMLKNHYSKPLDFNNNLIQESEKNLKSLMKPVINFSCEYKTPSELIDILSSDLNTTMALALLNEFNKNKEFDKLKNALIFLGIYDENILRDIQNVEILKMNENEINYLILERKNAKIQKDWAKCDEIRDYLKSKGILLKDTKNGTTWEITK